MRIADAAARIGVPPHRLRHYEASDLLVPARSPAGYRDYSASDIEHGKQIRALFDSGFTASDVALMLPCMADDSEDDRRCCEVTRARLTERLHEITERRIQLQRTEHALTTWLEAPTDQKTSTNP
ncbi:MerR family transcriptional regulator [Prescottella agglutinans]|uniref:MerR family copper efflux transcriptional regulator n=1 Tax=Prescottella agglutinans TaxID=1644129 RepID=A0ABT6M7K6_9NOCA|nr:MerR family transcriptional regulator [Prescottella agglutinans]MDH6279884.1 MerR family copper efflux transcriptional regulator [Prescottella agglutinans]